MISDTINGVCLRMNTSNELFSPAGLDMGTRAMLETRPAEAGEKVLDLGCGAGWVGIYASKIVGQENVVMCDVSENAVQFSEQNALLNGVSPRIVLSDGFMGLDDTGFSVIYSNPPYQTDFKVAKHFIEKGFNRLIIGGKMVMVVKRRAWYENKLRAIFGGCRIVEKYGYFVFIAEKRSMSYAGKAKK
ncbi:MAG: methyltransferase [Clostridia bacterium]|nr:methyltransferase [Clostridia bacterium]